MVASHTRPPTPTPTSWPPPAGTRWRRPHTRGPCWWRRWGSGQRQSNGGRTLRGGERVRLGHVIAGLHTGHDGGTGGHGVKSLKSFRHALPQVGIKLFENATSPLMCLTWCALIALGQDGSKLYPHLPTFVALSPQYRLCIQGGTAFKCHRSARPTQFSYHAFLPP